jgi:hypothetical protein
MISPSRLRVRAQQSKEYSLSNFLDTFIMQISAGIGGNSDLAGRCCKPK